MWSHTRNNAFWGIPQKKDKQLEGPSILSFPGVAEWEPCTARESSMLRGQLTPSTRVLPKPHLGEPHVGIANNEINQVFVLGTSSFLQLWRGMLEVWLCPSWYLAEGFLCAVLEHAAESQSFMSREKDVFMVFSCLPWSAACFWAVQLQIFCVQLQTPQKNSWEISEAAEQSGYNRNKKQPKKKKTLLKENCPRQPHGALSHWDTVPGNPLGNGKTYLSLITM